MPCRLIRAEILDSERVQTLPIEARWLFVGMLLTADDLGLFEVASYALSRRVGIDHKHMPTLLQLLADSDLIRLYEVDGKRYGFIPRYRQRLQIKRTKHPLPPEALMTDDSEAMNKIKTLGINPPLDNRGARNSTVVQPSEPEPEPEEERAKSFDVAAQRSRLPAVPHDKVRSLWNECLPAMPQPASWGTARQAHLRARWRELAAEKKWATEQEGLTWFRRFFTFVAKSPFLTGRAPGQGKRPFEVELPWLLLPENMAKTIEGKYHQEATA